MVVTQNEVRVQSGKKIPKLGYFMDWDFKTKKAENSFLISVGPKIMLGLTQQDKLTTVVTYQHPWKH